MKKIMSVALAGALVASLAGCGATSASAEVSASEVSAVSSVASVEESVVVSEVEEASAIPGKIELDIETPSSENLTEEGALDNFYVKLNEATYGEDYDGNPVVVCHYDFTNNSEESANAEWSLNLKAFQNGVELDSIYFADEGLVDYAVAQKEIKPGATIQDCQVAFVLMDASPVTVEVSALFSWSETIVTKTYTVETVEEGVEAGQGALPANAFDVFDEEAVIEQMTVEATGYSNSYSNYVFLIIGNNSDYDLSISANVNFYREDGSLVGAKDSSESPVQSGYETVLTFMPDEDFAYLEYELEVEEETYYDPIVSDLSYEITPATEKVIVSMTNNGTEPAEFVEGTVVFYLGDQVVGHDSTYFTDDDSELKPGKTINKELSCYDAFDSCRVFIAGRR